MEAARERGRAAVAAVPLVLVPALGAASGGFNPDAWVWAGALAAWAAAIALVLSPDPGALRRDWLWAATAGGLLVWTLLSAVWSVSSSQSILDAQRTAVYAAVILALLVLARPGSARLLLPATALAISGLVLYALVRYLVSERRTTPFEGYLLSEPLGYANAAGILAALGIVLAVGLASQADTRVGRAGAAAIVPPLALALDLSGSTASWLALAVGIAVAALLDRAPLQLVFTLAAVALPAGALVLLGRLSLIADATAATPRFGGPWLVLAACGAALVAGALVHRLPSAPADRGRRLVYVAVLVLALGGAAAIARAGATEPRSSYWHVAWYDEYRPNPVLGSGAGTFGSYWAQSGQLAEFGGALDAHSLYVETLAELGPLGLLLLLAMLATPFRAARSRSRYVPAALAAYTSFLVHAGLDWDWEMPVVVVAALCCAAAALTADLPAQAPLGPKARAAALLAAFSLAVGALAGTRNDAVPSAETPKAPRSGAFGQTRVSGRIYLP